MAEIVRARGDEAQTRSSGFKPCLNVASTEHADGLDMTSEGETVIKDVP